MISTVLTGHQHRNNPCESCDECGNCNGANCAICKTVWEVWGYDKTYYDYDKAVQAENDLKELASYNGAKYSEHDAYFIKDETLFVDVWDNVQAQVISIPCNKESSMYDYVYKRTVQEHARFVECTCIDKMSPCYSNSCDVHQCCTDTKCYIAMKGGRRNTRRVI